MFPSTNLKEINERLDLVGELINHAGLREMLVSCLRLSFDLWRLLQKFSIGRGDADDLLGIARTIKITHEIEAQLQQHLNTTQDACAAIRSLKDRIILEEPMKLAERILDAIDEDKLSEQHQIEDDQAAAVYAMAKGVASEEGEDIRGVPKSLKSRKMENDRDKYLLPGEVWIMRPR